jgi:hypothetical protein
MKIGGNMQRKTGFREEVKTYSFVYVPLGESAPDGTSNDAQTR